MSRRSQRVSATPPARQEALIYEHTFHVEGDRQSITENLHAQLDGDTTLSPGNKISLYTIIAQTLKWHQGAGEKSRNDAVVTVNQETGPQVSNVYAIEGLDPLAVEKSVPGAIQTSSPLDSPIPHTSLDSPDVRVVENTVPSSMDHPDPFAFALVPSTKDHSAPSAMDGPSVPPTARLFSLPLSLELQEELLYELTAAWRREATEKARNKDLRQELEQMTENYDRLVEELAHVHSETTRGLLARTSGELLRVEESHLPAERMLDQSPEGLLDYLQEKFDQMLNPSSSENLLFDPLVVQMLNHEPEDLLDPAP